MQAFNVGSPYENMKFINILDKLQQEIGTEYDWFVNILDGKFGVIDELTNEKEELEKELSEMEEELDKQEKESDKLQDKVCELEDEVKVLKKDLEDWRNSKSELESVDIENDNDEDNDENLEDLDSDNPNAFREHILMLRVRRDLEKTHELNKTLTDVSFDERRILSKNCPGFDHAILWYYNGGVLQSAVVKKTVYTRTLNKLKSVGYIKLREIDYYREMY